jgi:multiple sugar transport system ATP-binding protein
MRAEIKSLHQRLKTTTVYVTHDQVEAMTMADRIVVMHDGRIEQIGTPLALYDRPDNLFVAQFIGSPSMNVVNGTLRRASGNANGSAYVEAAGGVRWPLGQSAGADGQAVAYGIRPEHLSIAGSGAPGSVAAQVTVVEPTGAETELLLQAGEAPIVLVSHGRPSVNPGDKIGLSVDLTMVHIFDQKSGARLTQ